MTFQERGPQQVAAEEWELLASYAQKPNRAAEHRVYMVHQGPGFVQPSGQLPLQAPPHDLYWAMDELGSKIIVDLGCMRESVWSGGRNGSLHSMLRISVVSGNCPPLLSKSVCSRLGFMTDTEQYVISSKKFRVKPYGLEQTLTPAGVGGHYIMPLTQFDPSMRPVESCEMLEHAEIIVLSTESQRADQVLDDSTKADPQDVKTTIQGPS